MRDRIQKTELTMFGYVVINQQELKFREFDVYRSYYCGLCRVLKQKYGAAGQITLSYDTTFLVMLLTGLYEPEEETSECRCIAHPFERHPTRINTYTDYAADINIILSYWSCIDDWEDEKKLKKLFFAKLLAGKNRRAQALLKDKTEVIAKELRQLHEYEKNGEPDLDAVSGCFGRIMAEIFAFRHDEWEETLRRTGFYLGKFIYLMDAYDDLDKDRKSGSYNPLLKESERPDFDDWCRGVLTMMMGECSKAFELLPILKNAEILRNIIYSGVWARFDLVLADKNRKADN